MKKFMFIVALLSAVCFQSCKCNSTQEKPLVDSLSELTVENTISTDREQMYLDYNDTYRWFETCIVMKDYLDEESDGTVAGVSNIFQVVDEKDNGADVHVIMFTHVGDSTQVDIKHGFWVEDKPMNNEYIKVTFKEAYTKLMETNCPKPHSRNCVLRKEVGPIEANPQYIFGNQRMQVYVDAVTGEVSMSNPVYPNNLQKPLGEWP